MSVFIKGMEMPKNCGTCKAHFLSGNDYVCCCLTDRIPKSVAKFHNSKIDLDARKKSIEAVQRPEWCPLVELPEWHGRLIDADALCDDLMHLAACSIGHTHDRAMEMIVKLQTAPTIIEADGGADNG